MKHQSDILALKYRPTDFKDLIGQEYLVETIQKSIEINKIEIKYFSKLFSFLNIKIAKSSGNNLDKYDPIINSFPKKEETLFTCMGIPKIL